MPSICRYYNSAAGCRFGVRCRYLHLRENKNRGEREPCHFFRSKNGCRNGDRCRFAHVQPPTQLVDQSPPPPPPPPPPPTAEETGPNVEATLPVAVEDVAEKLDDLSIDDSKALVIYDPDVAAANIADAILKGSLVPKRKRRPGSELEKAKCSCCLKTFNLELTPEASAVALKEHYIEKFGQTDHKHLKFFRDNYDFEDEAYCIVCDKTFQRCHGLFRHLKAKIGNKKNPSDADGHRQLFDDIVKLFVDRDTGFEISDEDLMDELTTLMTDDMSLFDDDEDDDDDALLAYGLACALGGVRSNNFRSAYDDSSDDEYGPGMYGFSGSEVFELLCQGVKPWDSDAEDVLDVLNGCY